MGNSPLIRVMNDVYSVSTKSGSKGVSDTIILSVDELQQYILNHNLSKYRRNYNIKHRVPTGANITNALGGQDNYLDGMGRNVLLSDEDVKRLSELMISEIETRILSGLSSIFTDISSILSTDDKRRAIRSTVFNSDGIYNPMARSDMCVFPYRTRIGGLTYNCMPAKDAMTSDKLQAQGLQKNELICPTEVSKSKKINKWGYCPEEPDISRARMTERNTRAIDAYKYLSKNFPKRVGYCEFPFIYYDNTRENPIVNPGARASPYIRIAFDCVPDKPGIPESGSWCYVKSNDNPDNKPNDKDKDTTNSVPQLLIGTKKTNSIYYGKWSMDNLYKNATTPGMPTITQRAISNIHEKMGLKRAECNIKNDIVLRKRIEAGLNLKDVVPVKLIDYIPDKCILSESKRGYTKKQLYVFGRDELGINYNLMINKSRRIISKTELCEMFNRKIREIKKGEKITNIVSTANKRRVYSKDPTKCLMGPSKGGYSLGDLRDMAITHFGLSEARALQMNKTKLCDYIILQLYADGTESSDNIATLGDIDDIGNSDSTSSILDVPGPKNSALEGLLIEEGDLYPRDKNIDHCANSRGRGGLSKTQVTALAARLKIKAEGRSKEDICNMIRDKILTYQNKGYNPTKKHRFINKDDIKAEILHNISSENIESNSVSDTRSVTNDDDDYIDDGYDSIDVVKNYGDINDISI